MKHPIIFYSKRFEIFHTILPILLSLFIVFPVSSQVSDCGFLIRDGIRNFYKTHTYSRDYSESKDKICEAYSSYIQNNNLTTAKVKYAKVFKGGGSYSKNKIEKIGKWACDESWSVDEFLQNNQAYTSIIDPNWADVISNCINATANSISYKIVQSDDPYLGDISISIKGTAGSGQKHPKIVAVVGDSNDFIFSGDVTNSSSNLDISLEEKAFTLNIKRKDLDNTKPIIVAGQKVLGKSKTLTIGISNGQSIQIVYPTIPYEKTVQLTKGVGEIVTSLLDQDEFYNLYNKNSEMWSLADGSTAPHGTSFRQYLDRTNPLANGKIPDLRGVFLRGYNHNRNDGKGNPNPTAIGEHQMDGYANHTHQYYKYDEEGNKSYLFVTNTPNHSTWPYASGANKKTGGAIGHGAETRPRNVTVNFFIRIN